MEEEELRREIRDVFSSIPTLHRGGAIPNQGSGNGWTASLCFAAFRKHRKKQMEGVVLEQEQLGSILRFLRNSISALDAGFRTGKRYFPTEGVLSAFDFGIGSEINTMAKR